MKRRAVSFFFLLFSFIFELGRLCEFSKVKNIMEICILFSAIYIYVQLRLQLESYCTISTLLFVALLVCSAHLLPRSCHICIWTSVRLCCCSTLVDRSSRWSTEDFFFCFVNEKSLLSSFAFLLHTHNLKMYAVIRFAMTCRVECVTRTETNAADTF